MSLWVDHKFIGFLSPKLEKFSRKDNDLYNFRCPICGDSQKNKNKTRGYLFRYKDRLVFKCHNCYESMSFSKLLERIDPELYRQYSLEKFTEGKTRKEDKLIPKRKQYEVHGALKYLKKVSQLSHEHPLKKYILHRKIPNKYHAKLFYAPKFFEWVNSVVPEKFKNIKREEPRLIIPFFDERQKLVGFQGRALAKSDAKYITIMLDENAPKVFGLDTLNINKTVYVVEGPIDSMFLYNAIAMAGADINLSYLNKGKTVFVFDNERRNSEIIKRIEKTIESGYSVCIWPDYMPFKDINDMIMAGFSSSDIQSLIDNNTHSGMAAQLALNAWKRC